MTLFRVESVEPGEADGPVIRLDDIDDRETQVWSEARLIGRASPAYAGASTVVVGTGSRATAVALPREIRVGDLIAAPAAPVDASGWGGGSGATFIIQDVARRE